MTPRSIVAVILAGGQGTRIRHLLPGLPKPMAPALGRPFLEWVVRYLAGQGIDRILFSTGYKADTIAAHFTAATFPSLQLTSLPEPQPLGTAGGFLHAAASVAAPPAAWLILNGDSLALTPLAPLLATLDDPACDGALLGLPMADAARYGTLTHDSAHLLLGFAEKRPGAGLINAGVYLLRHRLLARFPVRRPLSFETDVFPHLLQSGASLQAVPAPDPTPFLDIGTPETLSQAEAFLAAHPAYFPRL